jgi:hypothetical protein
MRKDWALGSSLGHVIFESARSLQVMMETCQVDLTPNFAISIADSDCDLNFPGYFVDTQSPDADDLMHLVKADSRT